MHVREHVERAAYFVFIAAQYSNAPQYVACKYERAFFFLVKKMVVGNEDGERRENIRQRRCSLPINTCKYSYVFKVELYSSSISFNLH